MNNLTWDQVSKDTLNLKQKIIIEDGNCNKVIVVHKSRDVILLLAECYQKHCEQIPLINTSNRYQFGLSNKSLQKFITPLQIHAFNVEKFHTKFLKR